MICLRCGYCCQNLCVVIVDDPEKGVDPENLKAIGFKGPERCQHLVGDKPGEYSCAVHDRKWYKETPCASHGQIERSPTDECRMGQYILKKHRVA
jgi:hypothetical protein